MHPHESPWSMLGPLVILALLSIGGGWIGIERFAAFLAPAVGPRAAESAIPHLELILSAAAVAVALVGWLIADRLYRQKPAQAAQLAAALPSGYKTARQQVLRGRDLRRHRCEAVVRFLKVCAGMGRGCCPCSEDWRGCWAGSRCSAGAILQRWQSGNLRSYAAWLAAGAAALLLFVLVPWNSVWPASVDFIWKVARH